MWNLFLNLRRLSINVHFYCNVDFIANITHIAMIIYTMNNVEFISKFTQIIYKCSLL